MQTIKAALAYWGAVFALAFVIGALRVTWLAPRIGETGAVLIEVPVILAASWIAARWALSRFAIGSAGQASAMGALAFALLMASEALLALLLGSSLWEWLYAMTRIPGAVGLAGQVVFGVMPVTCLTANGERKLPANEPP
jgi:hypothetical protein